MAATNAILTFSPTSVALAPLNPGATPSVYVPFDSGTCALHNYLVTLCQDMIKFLTPNKGVIVQPAISLTVGSDQWLLTIVSPRPLMPRLSLCGICGGSEIETNVDDGHKQGDIKSVSTPDNSRYTTTNANRGMIGR